MGGNTVRATDLMPPEFYRAIYEHNKKNPDNPIYFFQSINPPVILPKGNISVHLRRTKFRKNLKPRLMQYMEICRLPTQKADTNISTMYPLSDLLPYRNG